MSAAIKGFDIKAGSIPTRRKPMGSMAPVTVPRTTTRNTVSPTTPARCGVMSSKHRVVAKPNSISVPPSNAATTNSRPAIRRFSARVIRSNANMRMMSVADWDPALPPQLMMSGINRIIHLYVGDTFSSSYCFRTTAVASAANIRKTSQTPRFHAMVRNGVSR